MPNRAHDPRVIQSSRLNCANAYLTRKSRLSFEMVLPGPSVMRPLSRTMSGVMRKATMWLMLPVTLM